MIEVREGGRREQGQTKRTSRSGNGSAVQPAAKPYGQRARGKAAEREDVSLHVSGMVRPLLLLIVTVLCAAGVSARLAFWTVMEHGHLAAAAQQSAVDVQSPARGRIYDAQGSPLATDISMSVVYAAPKEVKDPKRTAGLLAPVLHLSAARLVDLLTSEAAVVRLAPDVPTDATRKLRNLALPGILPDPRIRRYYPEGPTASQVLGFANSEGVGNNGVEGYYDKLLAGTAGLRSVLKDTAGNDIHISSIAGAPSHKGADLHLSLDKVVQQLAQDELAKAVKMHHADGGTIMVMDPRTGFLLGASSLPSYDSNHYADAARKDAHLLLNPGTQWTYEPGSTFKVITMAAGLDTGVIVPDTAFEDTGSFVVGDRTIHNWNGKGFGWETMTQVLQHSANVGASFVAQRLGLDRFYTYLRRFHFGQPTRIDLEGEESGILPLPGEKNWTIASLFTNSYGQGLSVTPLQMLRATSAVANGGILMRPQLVKQIVYDGHVINRGPVAEGRVISPRTAQTLTGMLIKSAIGGEAELGLVHGYDIAAKTGTANIAGPDGRYIQGATIASIVGYAPAYHPRFSALVIINHPRDTPWGSMAAAPVLHDLFQDLFMYYHIAPSPHAAYR